MLKESEVIKVAITKFIDTKAELDKFEIEKIEILGEFYKNINEKQDPEYRLACCMTAILYEYKRIESMPKFRECDHNPMADTVDGRVQMLLNYIQRNFDMQEIQEIMMALNINMPKGAKIDTKTVLDAIPRVEQIAEPVLQEIATLKDNLKTKFASHNIEFKHISPADITDGKINPSVALENQPQNNIVTGVFAESTYDGMNMYIGRAIAGGMIVRGDNVRYPRNPFAPIEEQKNPTKIKLARPVYSYSLPIEGFEPQVYFEKRGKNFGIEFGNEWVHETEVGVRILDKEEITEVSSGPFLARNVTYVDEKNRRVNSITDDFAKKFGIQLNEPNRTINKDIE